MSTTIYAVRDPAWRGSTHHLVLNDGGVYLDVIGGGAGDAQGVAAGAAAAGATFSIISMDGWGAHRGFVGCPFPAHAFEVAFGGLDAVAPGGQLPASSGADLNEDASKDVLETIRAALDAVLDERGQRASHPALVHHLASFGLATDLPDGPAEEGGRPEQQQDDEDKEAEGAQAAAAAATAAHDGAAAADGVEPAPGAGDRAAAPATSEGTSK